MPGVKAAACTPTPGVDFGPRTADAVDDSPMRRAVYVLCRNPCKTPAEMSGVRRAARPSPSKSVAPKAKALVTMWERRAELEGFAAAMEAVRNAVPGLKNRAIAGPHDYDQIPALVERSRQRVRNFYTDFDIRLADVPFIAGDEFSAADITAVVTVDFATKAAGLPITGEHAALKRWYDAVSTRASTAA